MKVNRPLTVLLIALLISSQTTGALPQATSQLQGTGALVLEDGTPIKLRIARTVSSADAHVGDTVDFEVLEDVKVGDLLVVPKGGLALATVTEAESKKRMARGGKLGMNIDSVRLLNGEKVALRAVKGGKGGGHTGAMTGAIVATAIVFWPAAPFFLFMHGKDITIPKGTEITAYINGDFKFDAERFRRRTSLESGGASAQQAGVSNATRMVGEASLEISSDPAGADIELDGNFVGNTPSSVGVAAGEHTLRVSRSGYKLWERKLRSSTGNIKIAVALETTSVQSASESAVATPAEPRHVEAQVEMNPPPASNAVALQEENRSAPVGAVSLARTPSTSGSPIKSTVDIAEEAALGVWFAGNPSVRHDGVEISGVQPGGPAESIDMRRGDWILALDGHYLYTINELRAELLRHELGTRLAIRYQRNKLIYDTYVVLGSNEPTH
jgi:hypothetical protein